MFRRLYRQRRRFLVATLGIAAILMGALLFGPYGQSTDLDPAAPLTWIACLIAAALVAGGLVIAFSLLLPDMRFGLELAIATFAVVELAGLVLPIGGRPDGVMGFVFFLSCFVLLGQLAYGAILDPVTRAGATIRQNRFEIDLPPEAVWKGLALLPETAGSHFYPGTRMTPEAGEACVYQVSYPLREGQTYQLERVSIDTAEAPCRYACRFDPVTETRNTGGLSGRVEITIDPVGEGAFVQWRETRIGAPLRRRLQWFMDDEFRDRTDSARARLKGRRDWSFFGRQMIRT